MGMTSTATKTLSPASGRSRTAGAHERQGRRPSPRADRARSGAAASQMADSLADASRMASSRADRTASFRIPETRSAEARATSSARRTATSRADAVPADPASEGGKARVAAHAGIAGAGAAVARVGRSVAAWAAGLKNADAAQKRRALVVAGVILTCVLFLYQPLRSLYVARRNEQVLTEQLAQMNATNNSLQSDIGALQTREGIEDAARRLGYVGEGETAVNVEGIDSSAGDALSDSSTSVAGTAGSSGSSDSSDAASTSDDPWYVRIGDFIFGYDPSEA